MLKAVVLDSSYGSTSASDLNTISRAYLNAGINLLLDDLSTEDEIIEGCHGAIAILGTGNPKITRKVLAALPDLRFIQRFGIGVNSIDIDAATELGKVVINLPGFCVQELADLAAAMILGLIRNVGYYDRSIRSGKWPKGQYLLPGNIRKMTLGLYGFGGSARNLYEIFHNGFHTRIISCDPYITNEVQERYDVEFVDFEDLIAQSDIISLHAPLTTDTYHIFNRNVFKKMKDTAMIINTARGSLICQDDLVWALEHGEIQYAGLDTVEVEPISLDSPLLKMDNVLLTPHSGFYGKDSKQNQIDMVCRLVPQAILTGELPSRNVVNHAVIKQNLGLRFV